VTIDGPAGAGKSTVAKLLASRLGYLYLDTGALYRALAWKVQTLGVNPREPQAVEAVLAATTVSMEYDPSRPRVAVDGQDVTDLIRTPAVSRIASEISAYPAVRAWLLPVQRRIGAEGGVVGEGRDLGTQVFPAAAHKFFLDAAVDVRANRRHRELADQCAALDRTRAELEARDRQDRDREVAPLVAAPDAVVIDSTTLSVEQVVDRMMSVIATAQP
jgi:cytidylate kinase